jgi:NifU-like protein involved in Fe-S cluster formation
MDKAVIQYYRELLKDRFRNYGVIVYPSIFLNSVGEMVYICGTGNTFMYLYLNVKDNFITDFKYECSCDPVANVSIEILCSLAKDKSLDEVARFSEKTTGEFLGTEDEELREKTRGILELLNRGIKRYREDLVKQTMEGSVSK